MSIFLLISRALEVICQRNEGETKEKFNVHIALGKGVSSFELAHKKKKGFKSVIDSGSEISAHKKTVLKYKF